MNECVSVSQVAGGCLVLQSGRLMQTHSRVSGCFGREGCVAASQPGAREATSGWPLNAVRTQI
eukprot:3095458-Amphidinium_carterae.1